MQTRADKLALTGKAIAIGTGLALAGHIPKDIIFFANLRFWPMLPWLIVPSAALLWIYWQLAAGRWQTPAVRHEAARWMRARRLSSRLWFWALLTGVVAIGALVMLLRVANRLVIMPQQQGFDAVHASPFTIVAMIVAGAVIAAVVEESAFRGHMQARIEASFGIVPAILITGFMFGIVHLDVTPVTMPYYVAVAALYGAIAWLTQSILPTIVLHLLGNIYSGTHLWLTGHAEWQRAAGAETLVWQSGMDEPFLRALGLAFVMTLLGAGCYWRLAIEARSAQAAD